MAGIMQSYLTCYYGDGPMITFKNEDIQKLSKSLLHVVVKSKILADCTGSLDLLKME